MAISFVGGALIERVVIRPVEHSSPLVIVIVTIGLFLAINSLAQVHLRHRRQARVPALLSATTPGGRAACIISADTLVLVARARGRVPAAVPPAPAARSSGSRSAAVASNPESSRLLGVPVGRDAHARLGPRGRARRARRRARRSRPRPALSAASMQAILVFAFAAAALGGFDSAVRRGGRRPDRRRRRRAHDAVRPRARRHRAARAVRADPARAAVPAGRPVRHRRAWSGCDAARAARIARSSSVVAVVVVLVLRSGSSRRSTTPTDTRLVAQALYIGIAAMGLNMLTGYNGQVSIGHGAFFGIGAYTTRDPDRTSHGWTRSCPTLPVVAAPLCFVVGALDRVSRRCGSRACTSRWSRSGSRCSSPTSPSRFVQRHRRHEPA